MTKEINHRSAQLKPHHPADDLIPDGHQVAVYLRKCWSVMTDALVLLIFTIAVYIAILYICRVLWNLYMATEMGKMFINYFPDEAKSTFHFLGMDPITLSIWITIYSFLFSIAVGAFCQLLGFTFYFFEKFGALGKALFCGLPLTALIASYVQPLYGFQAWGSTFAIVLLPSLSVFGRCFGYAEKLLPELSDMKKRLIG